MDMTVSVGDFIAVSYLLKVPVEVINLNVEWPFIFFIFHWLHVLGSLWLLPFGFHTILSICNSEYFVQVALLRYIDSFLTYILHKIGVNVIHVKNGSYFGC